MADVKSVEQQKVQHTQTEQVELQKSAEIVKETPKEGPALTKGQQEDQEWNEISRQLELR